MNPLPSKKWLILALALVNGFLAGAQSNGVPGPADYAAFSRFVTERNIFDPNRYPRFSSGPSYHPPVSRSAPTFTLVGTMNYQKGMFAFFDGNSSDLRKVLYQSDSNSIAGYTVAEITLTGVTLQSADKKKLVPMKIGEAMHRAGNEWQPAGREELPANTADSVTPAGTTPASAGEPNDTLKKLMQQREKELK
jgi:hypothetical protein